MTSGSGLEAFIIYVKLGMCGVINLTDFSDFQLSLDDHAFVSDLLWILASKNGMQSFRMECCALTGKFVDI